MLFISISAALYLGAKGVAELLERKRGSDYYGALAAAQRVPGRRATPTAPQATPTAPQAAPTAPQAAPTAPRATPTAPQAALTAPQAAPTASQATLPERQ
ncbi:MAG: hypothetical protein GX558_00550, partial [Clostridiales bacterium]|nr:hypothetical protein [Clostridiales bacterium]